MSEIVLAPIEIRAFTPRSDGASACDVFIYYLVLNDVNVMAQRRISASVTVDL